MTSIGTVLVGATVVVELNLLLVRLLDFGVEVGWTIIVVLVVDEVALGVVEDEVALAVETLAVCLLVAAVAAPVAAANALGTLTAARKRVPRTLTYIEPGGMAERLFLDSQPNPFICLSATSKSFEIVEITRREM